MPKRRKTEANMVFERKDTIALASYLDAVGKSKIKNIGELLEPKRYPQISFGRLDRDFCFDSPTK